MKFKLLLCALIFAISSSGSATTSDPNCSDGCLNPWTEAERKVMVANYNFANDSCAVWVHYRYRINCQGQPEFQILWYDSDPNNPCDCPTMSVFHININRQLITDYYKEQDAMMPGSVPPCPTKITGYIRERSSCFYKYYVFIPYAELVRRGWDREVPNPYNYWMERREPCDLTSCCIRRYTICMNYYANGTKKVIYNEDNTPVSVIPCAAGVSGPNGEACEPVCDNAIPRRSEEDNGDVMVDNSGIIKVYPNPIEQQQSLNLMYGLKEDTQLDIRVVDVLGFTVYSNNAQFAKGIHNIVIDTKRFQPGTYILKVDNGIRQEAVKFLVTGKN